MVKINGDSNAAMLNAYPKSGVDVWDQNLVNGEYVIAYEINTWLDHKLQSLLPQVGLQDLMQNLVQPFT